MRQDVISRVSGGTVSHEIGGRYRVSQNLSVYEEEY